MSTPNFPTLLANMIVPKNATLIYKCSSEQDASSPNSAFVRVGKIRFTSKAAMGFATGGKIITKSFRNLDVTGCENTKCPLAGETGCQVYHEGSETVSCGF